MEPARYRPITIPLADPTGAALGGGEWSGPGYPILGVQGLGSNHRLWELLARKVPGHRIVAADARGRASGFGVPSPHGITTQADDLAAVLDATGIDKVVVVGHSMGGFVSLRFAQRHPDRVAGLLLLDGGPPVKLPGILRSPRAVRFTFNRTIPTSGPWEDLAAYWARATKRAATYGVMEPDFVEWAFGIDLAGPRGAMYVQQDRPMMLEDAVECFTAEWRAGALASLSMPCRILLAEHGAAHGKRPLYRDPPEPSALSDTTAVERLPGTDHVEVVWDPRTVAALTALVPA